MNRTGESERVVAELDLSGVPEGTVLQPLEPVKAGERALFQTWETPLAPWGGFALESGLSVAMDGTKKVLSFTHSQRGRMLERAIVARSVDLRDGTIVAQVKPLDGEGAPNDDRARCTESLAGIVFRTQTSRSYYQFGIEGKRRAVLLRRSDDEWFVLAEQEVLLPGGFVMLEVRLSGDGIECACQELGVDFFCTDATFRAGKVGFRSLNRCLVASFRITQTPSQGSRDVRRLTAEERDEAARGEGIPDAVLIRTMDVNELGGSPTFMDFAVPGRYDMLIEGDRALRALSVEGEVLWEVGEGVRRVVFSRHCGAQGRLIYGFSGTRHARESTDVTGGSRRLTVDDEMVVIRGRDGQVLAREPLPPEVPTQRFFDFSPTSGALRGPEGTDIVLREWRDDKGGGGIRLWALDEGLRLLWSDEQAGAHYGHHWAVSFFDVDGCGRDELLAGGRLYRGDGAVIWVHDREEEMRRIAGAGHYDAVLLGALSGEPDHDPVAFLLGGSAGVYVVDAFTGGTRAVHRVGHAQGRSFGRVRADYPGVQVLVATRWANMGILTLFSGSGDRLWSIQPDYVGQGANPVTWPGSAEQLIWTNTSRDAQALYDGFGRRVKKLPELTRTWGKRMGKDVQRGGAAIRMGSREMDYLTLTCDGKLHVFGPAV